MMGPLPHSGGKKEKTSRDESCIECGTYTSIVIGEGVNWLRIVVCSILVKNRTQTWHSERIANTKDWLTPVILWYSWSVAFSFLGVAINSRDCRATLDGDLCWCGRYWHWFCRALKSLSLLVCALCKSWWVRFWYGWGIYQPRCNHHRLFSPN